MERFVLKTFNDAGDFFIANDCCGQGLYAKQPYKKGAIVTYFGEALTQPLENQNLLVGRCFEHAEYYRMHEEYRKNQQALSMHSTNIGLLYFLLSFEDSTMKVVVNCTGTIAK